MRLSSGLAAIFLVVHAATPSPTLAADKVPCRPVTHEGVRYTVCDVDLARHDIRLFWKNSAGEPYGSLSALPRSQGGATRPLLFATNAGMFHADLRPVGLYVEAGRPLVAANTRKGPGNFHLKPNGVFYVAGGRAGVMETAAFLRSGIKPDIATQSGPMLVIDGHLHPLFVRATTSAKHRNGIGTTDGRTVHVAITEDAVSFAAFGTLFRDSLKCRNALFLDGGSVPTLYAPGLGRSGNLLPMGPMLGVYAKGR
jgi:uncharacterized protein YigE (DUF2233 family)